MKKKREEDERAKKEHEEKQASLNRQLAEKDAKIAELEAQVTELQDFKVEAETLRADKQAAELKARQDELARFAELQGLDVKEDAVSKAIEAADYPALVAEAMKVAPSGGKQRLAPFAMAQGIMAGSEYGGLLDPVGQ